MKKLFTSTRFIAFGILVISLTASVYLLLTQSIRLDESQSLWVATKPLHALFQLTGADVHVPLYSYLLHFWLQVFGTDIHIARAMSVVFFVATIPLLYQLAKETSNRNVALLTIAIFAFSPFVLWYSSETRMYTLFLLVTTANNLFFMRFIRSEGKKGKLGYCITLIFGLYTHYFFNLLIATQSMFILMRYVRRVAGESWISFGTFRTACIRNLSEISRYVGTAIIGYLAFIPWIVYMLSLGGASNTQPLLSAPSSYNLIQTFVLFLFGFQSQALQSILVALWPLSVAALFFVFTTKKRIEANTVEYFVFASIFPIMLAFIGSYIKPIFLSRYLILVTPTLFFTLSWLILNHTKRIASILVTIVISVMLVLVVRQNVNASTPVKEDYAGVVDYLEQNATYHDVIVLSAPFIIYPVEYLYEGHNRLDTIPQWDRYKNGSIPEFSVEKLEEQIEQYKTQYRTMYVVLSYDQGYEDDIKAYLGNNLELLDMKQFPADIQVRHYKLRYDIDYEE